MAITKTTEIAKIEVVGEYKTVQVKIDTVIKEDGTEISRKTNRKTLESGSIDGSNNWTNTDISSEDAEVQAICNAAWTNTVKTSFKDYLISVHGT
tara:strand:+ start:855 stop:1139 length:285 start_codon:yes stop_codon:yes gene_type:complete